jgi:ribulose-5-phosphate 4-epimerase/fuculose-1-phosphate aldolase
MSNRSVTVTDKAASAQLVRWEVYELSKEGRILMTCFFVRCGKIFRFAHDYHPIKDKEQYDLLVQMHGPFVVGKSCEKAVYGDWR